MEKRHSQAPDLATRLVLALALALILAVGPAASGVAQNTPQGGADGLRDRLRALTQAEGIKVTGLDLIGPGAPRSSAESGPIEQRLQALLLGYNFVLFHDAAGRVSGLRVMGRSRAGPPELNEASVSTVRQGGHHLVDAVLVGPTGLWASRRLIVDTGASTVVLPVSAISSLGLRDSDLTLGTVETAGGKVPARMGRLAAVRVGHAEVKDVPVTFIADEHLGRRALLGMSFLDHFRLTIDDGAQRIILTTK